MYSLGFRVCALIAHVFTVLALMCSIVSLSDYLNTPSPSAEIQILDIFWFETGMPGKKRNEISMKMNITADLQSLFTWNTKQLFVFVSAEYESPKNALHQVSLWDAIISDKEYAKFSMHTSNVYRFTDQKHDLRGKEYNLTLHWHAMPKTGMIFADKIVMSGYHLPEEY